MRALFFISHPSRVHLFRYSINRLKKEGWEVEVAIITKDVTEELVKKEQWPYINIIPEGRRIKHLPVIVSTGINFLKTIYRLYKLTSKRPYNIFVSNDVLAVIGKIRNVPVVYFEDDDLSAVPEVGILHRCATAILAPESTDLGPYNVKKRSVKSYKELAYLHPKYFSPNQSILENVVKPSERFAVLRLVSLTASHDRGKEGIGDTRLAQLIQLLEPTHKIFISSERPLPPAFERYRINLPPEHIAHLLYFADIFIGDSQTMTSEAAVLGTPAIRYNDFVGKINVMEEKEFKYDLSYGFRTDQFEQMIIKIRELIAVPNLKERWMQKRQHMLSECEDINEVFYKMIINYAKK